MKIVDREKFANWILEDTEDFLANKDFIINSLLENNKISLDNFFDTAGFIPSICIKEDVDSLEEFSPGIDCILEPFKKKDE